MKRLIGLMTILVVLLMNSFVPGLQGAALGARAPGGAPLPLTSERRADFDRYITEMLAKTNVPGAEVAVVQNGQVIYLNGFGVRALDDTDPVTPDTLMMIGSVNKSMTSLLAATLVDEGRLTWDTPVISLLPTFAVADPALTQRLTVRDAFCMCTGMPARDPEFIFNSAELTPERLIASVKGFPLTAPLGQQFQYSNQMYAIGGYAATAAGGAPDGLYDAYVAAMRERVLHPLGMDHSTFSLDEVRASGNYAGSHGKGLTGEYQSVALDKEDTFVRSVAPAGALWSSARDMARYVTMELADGNAPDGTRVVSAANLEMTWKQQVTIPADPNVPAELAAMGQGYGMGWVLGTYRGHHMLSHNGGTFGFSSEVAMLPDDGLGVVVLTNGGDADILTYAIQFHLFDLLFGQPATLDETVMVALDAMTQQVAELQSQLGHIDPAAVTPYLGNYTNPDLGEVTVMLRDGKLLLDAGEISAELWPVLNGAAAVTGYLAATPPLTGASVTFSLDNGAPALVLTDPQTGNEYPFAAVG